MSTRKYYTTRSPKRCQCYYTMYVLLHTKIGPARRLMGMTRFTMPQEKFNVVSITNIAKYIDTKSVLNNYNFWNRFCYLTLKYEIFNITYYYLFNEDFKMEYNYRVVSEDVETYGGVFMGKCRRFPLTMKNNNNCLVINTLKYLLNFINLFLHLW